MAKSRAFGTIGTLPSGRIQARYWHLGKQTSAGSSFATKADARAWLASVETDLKRGDHFDPSGYDRQPYQTIDRRSHAPSRPNVATASRRKSSAKRSDGPRLSSSRVNARRSRSQRFGSWRGYSSSKACQKPGLPGK